MSNRQRLSDQELNDLFVADLLSRYSQIRSTRYVFVGNYRELIDLIDESERIWFDIPVRDPFTRHSPETLERLAEISRLLYNFLAIAFSLKDHTNRIVDLVFTESLYKAYEDQVQITFVEQPLTRFIQDLRNYSLHRKLPIAGAQTTLQNNAPVTTTMFLSKQKLLEWKDWSRNSKKFLEVYDSHIPIKNCIGEYYKIVKQFHQWLETYFFTIYVQPIKAQCEHEINVFKDSIPNGNLQEFFISKVVTKDSDILVDDTWSFSN